MNELATPAPEAFSSVHTNNFPQLLRELSASLLVTTFQAGRVIVLRPQRELINTHFFALPRPMGLAADRNRIFVGSHRSVHEYRNVPAVAPRLDPPNANDAVYLLRNIHVTGHVDIHEMAFAGERVLVRQHAVLAACARSTTSTASCRAGGRASSPATRRRIAAT